MKQLVQDYDSGEVRIEKMPRPQAKPRGVLVRNHASVVSLGTERQTLEFARSNLLEKARERPDLVKRVWNKVRTDGLFSAVQAARQRLEAWMSPGYSSAGTVEAIGDGVTRYRRGDRIACAGQGHASHGEFVWVPVNFTAPVPEAVPLADAAFTTLGSIALHGIHRADLEPGDRVAVIGLGVIGQLTARILHAYGHPVLGIDLRQEAVDAALAHGIETGGVPGEDDITSLAETFTDDLGVDATIITASTPSNDPLDQASAITRPRGTVCVVGQVGMEVDRRVFYDKELELTVSKSYGEGRDDPLYLDAGEDRPVDQSRWTVARNMREFLRLLDEDAVDVTDLVQRRISLDDAPGVYEEILDGDVQGGTVLIEYDAPRDASETTVTLSSPSRPAREGRIGIGVVGAGSFAQGTLLPILEDLDVRLVSLASAGGMSAAQAGERFGFEQVSSDAEALLEDEAVDAVVVATRHDLHAEFVVDALDADKDVFVEKPLALTVDELSEVMQAYEASDRTVFVDFNRRYAPLVQELGAHFQDRTSPLQMDIRVNAGALPDDHWLRDPEQGGGRIRGEACHFVDLLHHIARSPPTRVLATGGHPPHLAPEDHLAALLEFADGSRGSLRYIGHGPEGMEKERVEVLGGDRGAVLENFRKLTLWEGTSRSRSRSLRQDKGHRAGLETFLSEVQAPQRDADRFRSVLRSSLATLLVEDSLYEGEPRGINLGALEGPDGDA